MSQVKVLYDVGRRQGMFGTGVVFLGEVVATGQKVLFWEGLTWAQFLSPDDLEFVEGKATLAAVVTYASLAKTIPSGVTLNSQGGFTISNVSECSWAGNTDPNAPLFSLKASSVTAPTNTLLVTGTNVGAWKAGTINLNASNNGGGGGGTFVDANADGKDDVTGLTKDQFAAQKPATGIMDALKSFFMFFWENPILMAVGLFLLSELFGITSFLSGKKKKKRFKLFG